MPGDRALLLPTPGNPFLLRYWLDFYEKNIKSEITTLYIHVNATLEPDVLTYIQNLLNKPGIKAIYKDHQIEHGDAINELLDVVTEKYCGLIEDDCFVMRPGFINQMFEHLESLEFDVVGSKRGSCTQEILIASAMKYNLDYSGYGDTGCNFWPSFFFTETEQLKNTDRNFKAKEWKAGTYIPELDYTIRNDSYGDTFVNTSIQILAKNNQERIRYIPQNHASPDDIEHYQKQRGIFNGLATHIHIGSLSSFNPFKKDAFPPLYRESEKIEWERRIAFFLRFIDTAEPIDGLDIYKNAYRNKINEMIGEMELAISRIKKIQNIYGTIGL